MWSKFRRKTIGRIYIKILSEFVEKLEPLKGKMKITIKTSLCACCFSLVTFIYRCACSDQVYALRCNESRIKQNRTFTLDLFMRCPAVFLNQSIGMILADSFNGPRQANLCLRAFCHEKF